MTEDRPDLADRPPPPSPSPAPRPGRPRWRRALPGCLAVLVAVAVVGGGFYLVVTRGVDAIAGLFEGPEDFPGPGKGTLVFEVHDGDTAAEIGRALKAQGVVASVEAFTDAAEEEPESRGIQVGFYQLRRRMAAADALDVLIDAGNLLKNTVTIPEGLRVADVVAVLADRTDFSAARFEKVLDEPERLGLPAYARGNPEGYLFPATYDFGPDATPASILRDMVARWRQAAGTTRLEKGAAELGYSPAEVMTVASLVEAEASREEDRAKVARVIYNRLENDGEPTNGLLQLDATVNFAAGRDLGARTTEADRQIDSPYNTYRYPGLPPTPIEAPGEAAMAAAARPARGDWLFYVTVNLATGETKFAETLREHNRNVEELNEYCRTESERC